jgi:hypothetical protein
VQQQDVYRLIQRRAKVAGIATRIGNHTFRATGITAYLKNGSALTVYTFGTGVAQHTFCSHCGMHAFYVPRSQPDRITVNARCLDGVDGPSLKPTRFFDGRHWEEAQRRRIAEGGHTAAAGLNGAVTLKKILDRASE